MENDTIKEAIKWEPGGKQKWIMNNSIEILSKPKITGPHMINDENTQYY